MIRTGRTHHLARVLAPVALLGSVAVATPLAHAAPAQPAKVAQVDAAGVQRAVPGMHSNRVSSDVEITICIRGMCVKIKF
jgi:hypothetical protein